MFFQDENFPSLDQSAAAVPVLNSDTAMIQNNNIKTERNLSNEINSSYAIRDGVVAIEEEEEMSVISDAEQEELEKILAEVTDTCKLRNI